MTRTAALTLLGIASMLAGLAYWGIASTQGASFFGSSTIPLGLGYAAGGIVALAVIATEMSKVRF